MVDTRELVEMVTERWDTLSPKQRVIATALLDTPSLAAASTARDIAKQVGVDPGTVVRFAQALGFHGYSDLRQQLRHRFLGSLTPQQLTADQDPHISSDDALKSMFDLDLSNLRTARANLDPAVISDLADVLCSGRRVLIISAGSYAAPGIVLSHLCQSMGFPVEIELRQGTALAAHLTALSDRDTVLGISFWHGYRETVSAVEWARAHGLATFVITDTMFSPVARPAERVLVVPTEGMFFFQSMTAAMSVVNTLAVLCWLRGGRPAKEAMQRMRDLFERFDSFLD